jgi:hypothetical protein
LAVAGERLVSEKNWVIYFLFLLHILVCLLHVQKVDVCSVVEGLHTLVEG